MKKRKQQPVQAAVYGVPISAAEFANEPNMMEETGFPKGYTSAHYRRDQDLFFRWLRANYPDCLCVGPSTTGGDNLTLGKGGGIEQIAKNTCKLWCEDNALSMKSFCNYLNQSAGSYGISHTNNIYIGGSRRSRGFTGLRVLVQQF